MKNTIHMLKSVTNTQMMSFVITTEDGKVMLIDGGWRQGLVHSIGRRSICCRLGRFRPGGGAALSLGEGNASEKAGKGQDG